MGKTTGFLDYPREDLQKEPVEQRIKHSREFFLPLSDRRLRTQTGRCMNCGVPFCNGSCTISNLIPEFNEFVYRNQWREAYEVLQSTNNFPEITGRVCPALCEPACCAGIVTDPVSIKTIELMIVEHAFEQGWVRPQEVPIRNDIKVAVVGSGPAGLAAAQQLNLAGYNVTVFEKNEVIGGIPVLGIPDFKLEKHIVQRRVDILGQEGIEFKTGCYVGRDYPTDRLRQNFDYICLAGGSEQPRDMICEGRELDGIHFAMDFLKQRNRIVGNRKVDGEEITARNRHVVVIGGGDTGSDCVGTSVRQHAASVTQIEIMPEPPTGRLADNPWPEWPLIRRTSTSHEEGCERKFALITKKFVGCERVESLVCAKALWTEPDTFGRRTFREDTGSDFEIKADLVLLAMGFLHPVKEGLLESLGVHLDKFGNVKAKDYRTSEENIFAAGDMVTGQSLVVRAIHSGREMAKALDRAVKGYTHLH